MGKDNRYEVLKYRIAQSEIRLFNEIFGVLPKSVLARDIHIKRARMNRCIKRVQKFYLRDIIAIAGLIEVELGIMLKLALDQYLQNKEKA